MVLCRKLNQVNQVNQFNQFSCERRKESFFSNQIQLDNTLISLSRSGQGIQAKQVMDMENQWEGVSCPSKKISDLELDFSQIKNTAHTSKNHSSFEELLSQFNDSSLNINNIHFAVDTDFNSHIIKHKRIELKLILDNKKKTHQVLKSISSVNNGTVDENSTIHIYATKINLITDSWIIVVTSNELNICSMIIIWKILDEVTKLDDSISLVLNPDSTVIASENFKKTIHNEFHYLLPGSRCKLSIPEKDRNLLYLEIMEKLCEPYNLFLNIYSCISYSLPPISLKQIHFNTKRLVAPIGYSIKALTDVNVNSKNIIITKQILIPSKAATYLIGKKGKGIEEIRKQTVALIKIHDKEEFNIQDRENQMIQSSMHLQVITIRGPEMEVNRCEDLINKKVRIWELTRGR